MGGVEFAKINVYFTKCFWHGRRKRLLLLSVLIGRFQKAWFFQCKSCVSCPRRKEKIQLIGSELNSFDKLVWEYIKKKQLYLGGVEHPWKTSNYRWEVLEFNKKIAIIDGRCWNCKNTCWFYFLCLTMIVEKGCFYTVFWYVVFKKHCFL